MTKKTGLPKYVQRKNGRLYFVKRHGGQQAKWVRMDCQFADGETPPAAFWVEWERRVTNPPQVPEGETVRHVIAHYCAHRKFADLKPRTRSDYGKHLTFLERKIGHLRPRNIERRHVIAWLDAWAEKGSVSVANYRLRVLRILMEHAIDMGLLPAGGNPAKGVRQLKGQTENKPRLPWPDDKISAFRATATGQTLLLFEMLLGTGQRVGDVLDMKWGDFDGEALSVRQNKTGKPLWLPVTQPLLGLLRASERRSVFILTNRKGAGALSYRSAAWEIGKIRETIGAKDYDIHALRHTAAHHLAAQGHDDETIAAITGHSTAAMVKHYTGTARQIARAKKARGIE